MAAADEAPRLAEMTPAEIQQAVAERYGRVASSPGQKHGFPVGRAFAESVGYEAQALDALPASMADSFTGAGNPQPHVKLRGGERLLDLGCGAGLDLYLYAQAVGDAGAVIGLDMSEPMIEKARRNFSELGVENASFLYARADDTSLDAGSLDIVTANGILNLTPDRDAVIREAARVLRPGGRFLFAEITLQAELPEQARTSINDWFRCIGGAERTESLLARLERCGFSEARCLAAGRNARTGHEASVCAVVEAVR